MTDTEVLVSQNLHNPYALHCYKQTLVFNMKGWFLKTSVYQKRNIEKKAEVWVGKKKKQQKNQQQFPKLL